MGQKKVLKGNKYTSDMEVFASTNIGGYGNLSAVVSLCKMAHSQNYNNVNVLNVQQTEKDNNEAEILLCSFN